MGTDAITLAMGKWKQHCMFPAGQGKVRRGLTSLRCCFWPALPLMSEVSSAPGCCWCSTESPRWPRRVAVNEGVQHLVEDTAVPFTTLVGLAFLSVPLQAAAAFRGRHLRTCKAVQQAWLFPIGNQIFLRKCDLPWKIYTFQSNPSKTNPKDFFISLRILFFLSEGWEFFSMETPLICFFKPAWLSLLFNICSTAVVAWCQTALLTLDFDDKSR